MGWCSGSIAFEAFIDVICEMEGSSNVEKLKHAIEALEGMDWDCQDEFFGYNDEVTQAFKELHPAWEIEEDL